jgi:Abnormal spindle-like microcephaly-assoc'd, ASPM-SPD-2-Hydin
LLRDRILRAAILIALLLVLDGSAQAQGTSGSSNTSGGAGIALVQSISTDASNSMWASLAFGANNAAGNFIAVVIQGGQAGEAFSVTDSQGNTYQQAIQTNENPTGETIAIYYAMNIAGGANTVALFQPLLGSFRFAILEYSGVAKSNALDVAAAAQGSSASPNSGSVTTTASGDLLVGGILTAGGESYTPGSGYVIAESQPAESATNVIAEYQTRATAGSSAASASLGSTDFWAAVLAAFKPAGSGGPTPPSNPVPPTPPTSPTAPSAPTITNLNPTSGPVGTPVTILGTNFGSTMGTVTFNGVSATPSSWSPTSIVVAVPGGATAGNVVITGSGTASNGVNFNVTSTAIISTNGAKIALVQSAGTDASNSGAAALAFGSNTAAGNFIAVVIQGGQPGEAFSVTDSQGNTYLQAIQSNEDTAGETIAIYYAMNIAGGANAVYAFQSLGGAFRLAILEYSGVARTNALDVAAAAQGAGASPNSGNVTTTANGDLLLGGIMTTGEEFYTAGAGYTIEQSVPTLPNTKVIAEDQIQSAAGATSATASLGVSDFWAAVVATFKPAAGGSGNTSSSGSTGSSPSTGQGQLSSSALALNFGNLNIGSSSSQTVTLSDSGTARVVISNVSILGAGISSSGVYVGLVLTPGEQVPLNVTFAPASTVSVSGSITVTSDAANSPMSIAVSGAGLQLASHSADLAWNASSGAVGYNVYRGTVSGGPYASVTSNPVTTTSFIDANVQVGQTYYYVVTSLNSNGVESAFSNQAAATIP